MAIIRWSPWFGPRWARHLPSLWEDEEEWPEMRVTEGLDVFETDKEVVVKAAVPGVPADKVEVTVEGGILRIRAKVEEKEEEKKKKKVVYRHERIASFDYTTTLPREVDATKVSAEVEDGVVIVKAPISPQAKPKTVKVKAKSK